MTLGGVELEDGGNFDSSCSECWRSAFKGVDIMLAVLGEAL